jgi:hypothetical protein
MDDPHETQAELEALKVAQEEVVELRLQVKKRV